MAVSLAIVLIVAFTLVTWKWRDEQLARQQAESERNRAQKLRSLAENGLIVKADLHFRLGNYDKARRSLATIPREQRQWEWRYLSHQLDTSMMTFQAGTQQAHWVRCLAFNPDGTLLATGAGLPDFVSALPGTPGRLRIWDIRRRQLLHDFGEQLLSPCSIAFSPDDRRIAVCEVNVRGDYQGEIKIWDVATQTKLVTLTANNKQTKMDPHLSLQFSPDGKLLAGLSRRSVDYVRGRNTPRLATKDRLTVWDSDSWQTTLELPCGPMSLLILA